MWRFVALLVATLCVAEGKNLTAELHLLQHWDNNWEGQFCFNLDHPIIGFEVVMNFDVGVGSIQQWLGDFLSPPGDCAQELKMINQDSHGSHPAGEFCVKMMGKVCGSAAPKGTATLVDLTDDGMQPPEVPQISGIQSTKYNYAEVLEKSILFFEAQRSGKLPADNRIPWRGDSGLEDKGAGGEDLTGGWYDAGDNVKFNFPMAFSTTELCWSLLEFPEAYSKSGQLDYMYDTIRWPLEYLVKCHTGPNELYVQVGNGGTDHATWTSPERMSGNRPAYKITASKPGSDVAGETAAAMACGALAFKTKDPQFASTLLTHAKQIYEFAKNNHGFYSTSVDAAAGFYKSSNYTDELTWGALWLNKATGDAAYLADAEHTYIAGPAWGFSWDEKLAGNKILLYDATQKDIYKNDMIATMTDWFPGGSVDYTPKCLAWRLQWGALRYMANTAFIALLTAKRGVNADKYNQWAMCQINYALGDGGRSYVVGFGTNPPTRPHHRASSCPMLPAPCTWEAQQSAGPNPHTLYGALVGGPGSSDDYKDDRLDYVHNEVACDYNAGFQGAIAGLLQLAIDQKIPSASSCGSC